MAQETLLSDNVYSSYEECLAAKRSLHEQSRNIGDRAWQLVSSSGGFTGKAARALYQESNRISEAAWKINCFFNPQDKIKKDKGMDQILSAIDRLRSAGLKSTDPTIKKIIDDRFKEINAHQKRVLGSIDSVGLSIKDLRVPNTPPPAPEAKKEPMPQVSPPATNLSYAQKVALGLKGGGPYHCRVTNAINDWIVCYESIQAPLDKCKQIDRFRFSYNASCNKPPLNGSNIAPPPY